MAYTIETKEEVMTFTIDRPEIRNAINEEVMHGFEELVERATTELPRLVIITAAGDRAFCSGGGCADRARARHPSHTSFTDAPPFAIQR